MSSLMERAEAIRLAIVRSITDYSNTRGPDHFGRFTLIHRAEQPGTTVVTVGTPAVPDYLPTLGAIVGSVESARGDEWAVTVRQSGRDGANIYGTQLVHWDADSSRWVCHGAGHYDQSRAAALRDMMGRAGYPVTRADCEDCQTTAGCRCNDGNR